MEVKKGYQMTEVGVIPQEWEVKDLNSLSEKIMVGIASSATHAYRQDGVIMFRNQNIKPNYLDDSDILYINPDYEAIFKNKRLKKGDLLTARTGYPGTTCKVPEEYEGSQSFTTLITRVKDTDIDTDYLCFYINSEKGQLFFEQNQIGGGQKNVNAGTLKLMPIPIPPTIAEQTAIATALSDVDALISSLEKLIEKKRLIKQGAMQELLRAKERLPGFKEKWEEVPFGNLASFRRDKFDPKAKSSNLPCVELENIEQEFGLLNGLSEVTKNSSIKTVFKKGDVLFGKLRAYLKKFWLAQFDGLCSTEIWALVPNIDLINPAYLFQVVRSNSFIEVASTAYGTHMPRSDWNVVKNFEVLLPSLSEQTAIATVLSDMDAEIETLTQTLSKYRHLKQGMMQELLTGKTRLV